MTLTQANREKTKVKLSAADPGPNDMIEKLPRQLQDLIARSMTLQSKVRRLDTTIHAPAAERAAIGNPLVPAAQSPEGGLRALVFCIHNCRRSNARRSISAGSSWRKPSR